MSIWYGFCVELPRCPVYWADYYYEYIARERIFEEFNRTNDKIPVIN